MRKRLFIGIMSLVALSGIAAVGYSLYAARQNKIVPEPRVENLLFVVVDTLRAESMSLYGYKEPTTPFLETYAEGAVVFDNAYAQGTYTPSSYLSYMTATHVRTHGWDFPFTRGFPKPGFCGRTDLTTLAELLSAQGFVSTAFVSNRFLHPKRGFPRGFHTWNHMQVSELRTTKLPSASGAMPKIPDRKIVRWAEEAIGEWKPGQRQFLYVHLMTTHLPHMPSATARKRFGIPEKPRVVSWPLVDRITQEGSEEGKAMVRRFYHGSVFDADRSIEALLHTLDAGGHASDTMVVIASDHGEQLWEYGEFGHESGVWEQLSHVPLIVRIPGVPAQRISKLVSLIDIAPTAIRALGISETPSSWQGADLFGQAPELPIVSQRLDHTSVRRDPRYKFVHQTKGGWAAFDLETSRDEETPVILPDPRHGRRAERAHRDWLKRTPKGSIDRRAEPVGICSVPPEEEERELQEVLRALGYVQ